MLLDHPEHVRTFRGNCLVPAKNLLSTPLVERDERSSRLQIVRTLVYRGFEISHLLTREACCRAVEICPSLLSLEIRGDLWILFQRRRRQPSAAPHCNDDGRRAAESQGDLARARRLSNQVAAQDAIDPLTKETRSVDADTWGRPERRDGPDGVTHRL
jgi:hypothetical protein